MLWSIDITTCTNFLKYTQRVIASSATRYSRLYLSSFSRYSSLPTYILPKVDAISVTDHCVSYTFVVKKVVGSSHSEEIVLAINPILYFVSYSLRKLEIVFTNRFKYTQNILCLYKKSLLLAYVISS